MYYSNELKHFSNHILRLPVVVNRNILQGFPTNSIQAVYGIKYSLKNNVITGHFSRKLSKLFETFFKSYSTAFHCSK